MSKNFASMEELMHHRDGELVIDLLSLALGIDDDECLDMMAEPTRGIYLAGRLEPSFLADKTYQTRGEAGMSQPTQGSELLQNFTGGSDIYQDGRIVMTGEQFMRRKKYFTETPKIPITAIKVMAALVRQYVLKQTSVVPMGPWFIDVIFRESDGSVSGVEDSLYPLVKPEGHHLIEREVFETLCGDLLDQVREFIADDCCNIYRCYLKNTTLHVVKGVDWRIYSFHRDQFEKEEEERENGRRN